MSIKTGPFKIEITSEKGEISFTSRIFGEIGKDILAIKMALGVIQDTSISTESRTDADIPLDSNGWFDCTTGRGISMQQATSFNSKLQSSLTNYQIRNQFLILCYLFEKYGVKNIIDSVGSNYNPILLSDQQGFEAGLVQQIDAIQILFDKEVGTIGEATLAVMHGWLPHTTISTTGYSHSNPNLRFGNARSVHDVLPEVLMKDFDSGLLGQTKEDLVSRGYVPGTIKYSDQEALVKYLQVVSESQRWLTDQESPFPFGSIEYMKVPINSQSVLYRSTIQVLERYSELELARGPSFGSDTSENLRRVFYPDPFSATEPFYIGEDKTGYYLETDFELSPTGQLPTHDEGAIAQMEQKALDHVLKFYNKPTIWHLPVNDEFSSTVMFGSDDVVPPKHSGQYPLGQDSEIKKNVKRFQEIGKRIEYVKKEIKNLPVTTPGNAGSIMRRARLNQKLQELSEEYEQVITDQDKSVSYWVLGTSVALDRLGLDTSTSTTTGITQSWRAIEGYGNEPPLVKFVEYKTPSMRPGQKYRALFELSSRKIDIIKQGIFAPAPTPVTTAAEPSTSRTPPEPNACGNLDDVQSLRTLEEYRIHARKKRREIVRKLREELQDEEVFRGGKTVDLGTWGPFDPDSALKSILGMDISGGTDYEYTKRVLSRMGDLGTSALQGLGVLDTDVDYFNSIAKDSNPELTKDDLKGKSSVTSLNINLEEFDERVDKVIKDLQESANIIASEGILFKKGSKFDAKEESGLIRQFASSLKDLIRQNASDYYGAEVANYMFSNPQEAQLFLTFQIIDSGKLGPRQGKKIIEYAVSLPIDTTINGKSWFSVAKEYNEKAIPGPVNFLDTDAVVSMVVPDVNQDKISKSKPLSRPRTVSYISNLREMTGLLTDRPGEIISIFDDGRGACKDLGINFEKRQASSYIARYTTGVLVKNPPGDSTGFSWSAMAKEQFVDPAKGWIDQGSKNWESSWNSSFDENAALRAMGEMCTLEELYKEFFDKLDLASLLCDWLKCIRLPNFNIKLPSFYLPPFPRIPILGWYTAMLEFLVENIKQILTRLVCSFVRAIIDKLAIPFCEEQLRDFIAAGSLSNNPSVNQALAAALLDTGIPSARSESAKKFFDDVASITTGEELCHLLSGKALDNASMLMIRRLVEKNRLQGDLVSESDIMNYFDLLGTMMPFELCEELQKSRTFVVPKSCVEVSDYISDIRNRLQSGDSSLSDEEIERVVKMAQEEMERKQQEMQAFSGNNIGNLMPNLYGPGDPKSIISEYPDFLKRELNNTVTQSFSEARVSYVNAMGSYVPNMSIALPSEPKAGTDNYSDFQSLSFEAALSQLGMYAASLENNSVELNQFVESELGAELFTELQENPGKIQELIASGRGLNDKFKELYRVLIKHIRQFDIQHHGNNSANGVYWNQVYTVQSPESQFINGTGPLQIEKSYDFAVNKKINTTYGSVQTLGPEGRYADFLQRNGFEYTYAGAGITTEYRNNFYTFIEALYIYLSHEDRPPSSMLHPRQSYEFITNNNVIKHFYNKFDRLCGRGHEENLMNWLNLATEGELSILPLNLAIAGLEYLRLPNTREMLESMFESRDLLYSRWTDAERESPVILELFQSIIFGIHFAPPGVEEDFIGHPFLSFDAFYENTTNNVWERVPANFTADLETDYVRRIFNTIRMSTDSISHLDLLIEEYNQKTNSYENWPATADTTEYRRFNLRHEVTGYETDGVFDSQKNPYILGKPSEQDFIENFIEPQLRTENQLDDFMNHALRNLEFLEFMIAHTDPEVDHITAVLKKLQSPVDIYWYNAMLLYSLFETEEVPFETDNRQTHKVFSKSKSLIDKEEHPFIANIRRSEDSLLNSLIDSEPTFNIVIDQVPDDGKSSFVSQASGVYRGVFNPKISNTRVTSDVPYEQYYDSISDSESKDDFVLSAISIENELTPPGDSTALEREFNQAVESFLDIIDVLSLIASGPIHNSIGATSMTMSSTITAMSFFREKMEEYVRKDSVDISQSGITRDGATLVRINITPEIKKIMNLFLTSFRSPLRSESQRRIAEGIVNFAPNPGLVASVTKDIFQNILAGPSMFNAYNSIASTGASIAMQIPLIAASLNNPVVVPELRLKSTLEVIASMYHAITNSQENLPDEESSDSFLNTMTNVMRIHEEGVNEDSMSSLNRYIRIMNREPNSPGLLKMINERINVLTNNVTDAIRNRPAEVTSHHLLILDKIMKKTEMFRSKDGTFDLSIEAGIYKPEIRYIEHPSAKNLERYDIEVISDFHLRQPSSTAPKKIFKFCESLPNKMVELNSPDQDYIFENHTEQKYFSKRESFLRMVLSSFDTFGFLNERRSVTTDLKESLYKNVFKEKQDSIMEMLTNEIKNSRLFNMEYATELDARLSAKPIIREEEECVINRYGLTEASVLSFNKVILEDAYVEIMKETAKPENSPSNRDFDDPTPLDIALQGVSLKAFVRVCLIDTLLKGGLAYSVWDIAPVISSPVFMEYLYDHVEAELENSRFFKDVWRKIIESVVGITNPKVALKKLIEQESIKLPDYSKQVFNFDKKDQDFFDWFIDNKISQRHIMNNSDIQNMKNFSSAEEEDLWLPSLPSGPLSNVPFFFEDYVKLSGKIIDKDVISDAKEKALQSDPSLIESADRNMFSPLWIDRLQHDEIYIPTYEFDSLIRILTRGIGSDTSAYREIIEKSEIHHGIRLIMPSYSRQVVNRIKDFENNSSESRRTKSFLMATQVSRAYPHDDDNPLYKHTEKDIYYAECAHIPVVIEERKIDLESCESALSGNQESGLRTKEQREYMISRIKETDEFGYVLEKIFPIKRYVTMTSIFATSVLSGYNGMPTLFASVKASIAFLGAVVTAPRTQRDSLIPLSAEDFSNMVINHWPSHADSSSCFDFPGLSTEFFEKFFKDLWKLITQLPSILFRGVANMIDPAYKEMKNHYLNCDIKSLDWSGVKFESYNDKLTNGLYLPDTSASKQNNGKYAPIIHTGLVDMVASTGILFSGDARPLMKTVMKTMAYAYSGQLPFIDASYAFQIPCLGINEAWRPKGKYDLGRYGRYGHPLTPFTILALSTPELESDKKLKLPNCVEVPIEEYDDCEEE